MERMLKIGEAAKLLDVTVKTLQRWEREGRLIPTERSPGNRRLYSQTQIAEFQENHSITPRRKQLIAYCRVNFPFDREDLDRQRETIQAFIEQRGWREVKFITEIGYDNNLLRPKFLTLIDDIADKQVKKLIVTAPNVLTRSEYKFFERFIKRNGCELIILSTYSEEALMHIP